MSRGSARDGTAIHLATREFVVDGTRISDDSPCYVVAEIGHNHQGKLEICQRMFERAKAAGASAVKLQKRDIARLYTKSYRDKPYGGVNSYGATYGRHREALELTKADFRRLQRTASDLGITFFATAFDVPSADFLADIDMPAIKIASGDIRSLPFLDHVARLGRPIVLSTGAASMSDVSEALATVADANRDMAVLQCTASYPASDDDLDLRVISTYRSLLPKCVIGWSAHDIGIELANVAYGLGARIVEKHFTLDRTMRGTDHAFSLEPGEFAAMVDALKRAWRAMGSATKRIHGSEALAVEKMAKQFVFTRALPAGHRLRAEDLELRSPGTETRLPRLEEIVGRMLARDVEPEDVLRNECLAPAAACDVLV